MNMPFQQIKVVKLMPPGELMALTVSLCTINYVVTGSNLGMYVCMCVCI